MRRTKGGHGGGLQGKKKLAHTCIPDFDLSETINGIVESNISFCLSDRSEPGCHIVQVSPEFCKMTGYNEQEVIGRNCRFLQGKDTDQNTVNVMREAITNLEECTVIILNYKKDGTKFMNLVRLLPIVTESQSYYLGIQLEVPMSCIHEPPIWHRYCPNFPPPALERVPVDDPFQDITGFELLSKSLNEMCRTYIISDAKTFDQPILYASPGFYSLTGYNESEVLGKNCRFLQGFNTNKETVQKISDAVKKKKGITALILNYKKDGSPFWNMLVMSCIRNHLGEVEYFIGVQLDISAQASNQPKVEKALVCQEEACTIGTSMEVAKIHNLLSQIEIV
uniref:Putative LOV domain-containing protein n=1 Tax=Cymbomonas sp. BC-2016 TaxID=1799572 RepID=A0A126X3N9_9CHLO|nr:putative LOV domain-containing protein [Cymbomonas sp. BC-2016]